MKHHEHLDPQLSADLADANKAWASLTDSQRELLGPLHAALLTDPIAGKGFERFFETLANGPEELLEALHALGETPEIKPDGE